MCPVVAVPTVRMLSSDCWGLIVGPSDPVLLRVLRYRSGAGLAGDGLTCEYLSGSAI